MSVKARYLALLQSGELQQRVREAYRRLASCDLCPRACGVNRRKGERGACHTGELARVANFNPHFGEEAPHRRTSGAARAAGLQHGGL
jgi:putative pyruvate formate lyase activating enzyme